MMITFFACDVYFQTKMLPRTGVTNVRLHTSFKIVYNNLKLSLYMIVIRKPSI